MKKTKPPVTFFWFRRDLRLDDNAGLFYALKNHDHVQPLFIFDTSILKSLPHTDQRVLFIYQQLEALKMQLQKKGADLWVELGTPLEVFKKLESQVDIQAVYANHDYEPKARARDEEIAAFCLSRQIQFLTYKDQCIFEKKEIVTDQQKPYTVFTPYKKKWLASLSDFYLKSYPNKKYAAQFRKVQPEKMISLKEIGFSDQRELDFPSEKVSAQLLREYADKRDFPFYEQATSHLGLHLRFGTVSVRKLVREARQLSPVWLSELIWRDFFMQVLWNFPHAATSSFRPQFEKVAWRENKAEFKKWCEGQTGYPMVDAGMRELNATGFMHNRARMVTASFLTKHLLMHWSLGERYFAEKLLDYDLSANNGNWQWAAGTGCDAAPYFRIFNPSSQFQKFDPDAVYVKKWVPEYGTEKYAPPMVDHTFARDRALAEFKRALK